MRRSRQVLLACVVLAGLGFFFLAPVFYWVTIPDQPPASTGGTIYRSASCIVLGYRAYGVLYFPNRDPYDAQFRGAFSLGCEVPVFCCGLP